MAVLSPSEDSRKRPRSGEISGKHPDLSQAISIEKSDYQIINHPRRFFKKGKFFMASWVEPLGFSRPSGRERPDSFSETRRFMVVRSKPGHCLCLSVHTYGRQATAKRGLWADEHAAIIPQGGYQVLHPGEPELKKQPIQDKLESTSVFIDAYSRIDFSRIYTVEYNIPVKNIGRILPADMEIFEIYFSQTVNITSLEVEDRDRKNSLVSNHPCPGFQVGRQPDVAIRKDSVRNEKQDENTQHESWDGNTPQDRHRALYPRAPNWLLELAPYKTWFKNNFSLLWITGTSHTGNSNLAHWLTTYQLPFMGRRIICSVSFREGKMSRNNWSLALHSLLIQLLLKQPLLAKYLENDFQIKERDIATPSTTFWKSFIAIVGRATENVTCVLDGLDEVGTERREVFESLYGIFCSAEAESTPDLRLSLVITSQPDPEIDCRFHKFICHVPLDDDWAQRPVDEKRELSSTHRELVRPYNSISEQLAEDPVTMLYNTPQD